MLESNLLASKEGSHGRKILIVDDADELRELYECALNNEGYAVKSASLAESALEIVRTWRPDLVLTDIFMPGIGGFGLITRLRSDLAPPVPPIVVISGFPDAKAEAIRRGASRFETKPLSPDEILRVVEDVFADAPAPRVRPPELVRQRREATRAIGEATLTRYLTEDPGVFARMDAQVEAMARFFGGCSVLVFMLRDGTLKLVASSNPGHPPDADATNILPLVNDVVETAGSLVVTNGASQWLAHLGVHFLVAVPLVLERAVVGALCLVDEAPHDFGGAALGILEYIARRAAAGVRGGPRTMDDSGLLEHAAFAAVFHGSVVSAQDAGHALGFTMFEVTEVPRDGSLTPLFVNLPAPNLMIGVLDRHHLAAFAVAESVEPVKERLTLIQREIESRLAVERTAVLAYDDPVPRMEVDRFIARARELLTRAAAERKAFLAVDALRR
jgi:CheY-like chemotaxis protein